MRDGVNPFLFRSGEPDLPHMRERTEHVMQGRTVGVQAMMNAKYDTHANISGQHLETEQRIEASHAGDRSGGEAPAVIEIVVPKIGDVAADALHLCAQT